MNTMDIRWINGEKVRIIFFHEFATMQCEFVLFTLHIADLLHAASHEMGSGFKIFTIKLENRILNQYDVTLQLVRRVLRRSVMIIFWCNFVFLLAHKQLELTQHFRFWRIPTQSVVCEIIPFRGVIIYFPYQALTR